MIWCLKLLGNGDVVPCYDHMAALPFDEEFRGSVGILRDASAEQRRREQLAQQNERLEEFTSIVSHDLRTPLSNAEAAAELARTTGSEDAFARLEREHERMEEMIEELLILAREGETVSEVEPVDVAAVATEAWESFRCPENDFTRPNGDIVVDGDESRIRRLFENLFRNSVEHSQSPASVKLGPVDGGFYVADDGPGIDESQHEKVFEAGYTTAKDGTRFGLSVVKRIADAHGWEITLSDSDADGVRFEFRTDTATQRQPTTV